MPQKRTHEKQEKQHEHRNGRSTNSSGTIASWWQRIHFSGRVIIGSVLFGLGLVLIGSLVFAINMDDESTNTDNNLSIEIPTKAPSNVVGPALMGIGGFIVIVGIVMCLFETQVCRKKTGDSSPLISEGASHRKDSEAVDVPSTSHSHRHGGNKTAASPKRSKGRHAKDKNSKKTGSPRSPAITIETQRNYLTSSDEGFLTPPNTLNPHPPLQHSNSRDAENQTSSSLMKSFNSSAPSWTQSNEFQTPSTSFRDTSISLDNSIELNVDHKNVGINTLEVQKVNFQEGFLTPVALEDEKIKKLSSNIDNQKKELSSVQSNSITMSTHVISNENDSTSRSTEDPENVENNVASMNQQELAIDTKEKTHFIDASLQSVSPEQIIVNKNNTSVNNFNVEEEMSVINTGLPVTDEIGANTTEISVSKEDLKREEDHNVDSHIEANVKIVVERADLESSVSSDETVTSLDSVLEQHTNDDLMKENSSEPPVVTEIDNSTPEYGAQSNEIEDHKSQSDEMTS